MHYANFCLFCKNICQQFHSTSVHGVFFFHQNFVKSYQTSKALSSCLGDGRIFVKRENCQILQSAGVYNVNENVNEISLILLSEYIQAEPAKILNFCVAIEL